MEECRRVAASAVEADSAGKCEEAIELYRQAVAALQAQAPRGQPMPPTLGATIRSYVGRIQDLRRYLEERDARELRALEDRLHAARRDGPGGSRVTDDAAIQARFSQLRGPVAPVASDDALISRFLRLREGWNPASSAAAPAAAEDPDVDPAVLAQAGSGSDSGSSSSGSGSDSSSDSESDGDTGRARAPRPATDAAPVGNDGGRVGVDDAALRAVRGRNLSDDAELDAVAEALATQAAEELAAEEAREQEARAAAAAAAAAGPGRPRG